MAKRAPVTVPAKNVVVEETKALAAPETPAAAEDGGGEIAVVNKGALATLLNTPCGEDSAKADSQYLKYPYIGFFGPKTRNPEPLEAVGLEPHDFYLNDLGPIKVSPFTFHLLQYHRFYVRQNDKCEITAARFTNDDDSFKEHIFFVAAVRLFGSAGVSYIPAVGILHGAHCAAFKSVIPNFDLAHNVAGWTARGQVYEDTKDAKHAGGRLIVKLWSEGKSGASGSDYNLGSASTQPTPKAEIALFNEWLTRELDEANPHSRLFTVLAVQNKRITDTRNIARGVR